MAGPSPIRIRFARVPGGHVQTARVQQAAFLAKADAVVSGNAFAGPMMLLNHLQRLGIPGRLIAPVLLPPTKAFCEAFYWMHRSKDWFGERHMPFLTSTHTDARFPQGPMLAFIVEAPYLKEAFKNEKGEAVTSLLEVLRRPDVMGPTNPEQAIIDTLVKGNTDFETHEATLAAQRILLDLVRQSVRFRSIIGSGGSFTLLDEVKPLFNMWHCSAPPDAKEFPHLAPDADAKNEIATIYNRRNLAPYYDSEAVSMLCGEKGKVEDLVTFPLLEVIASQSSGLREAARNIYELMRGKGFKPNQFAAFHIETLLRQVEMYLPRLLEFDRAFARAAGITDGATSIGEVQPFVQEESEVVIIVGTSGSGKSTIISELFNKEPEYATLVPIYSTRENVGDVGRVGEIGEIYLNPEEMYAWVHGGRIVAAEENYGNVYAVSKTDLQGAILRGGRVLISAGPEIADAIRQDIASIPGIDPGKVKIKTVYLKVDKEAIERRLEMRQEETGRPAKERIEQSIATMQILEKMAEKGFFDVIIDNTLDVSPETKGVIVEAFDELISEALVKEHGAPEISTNPRRLLIERSVRKIIDMIKGSQIDVASAETIDASIRTEDLLAQVKILQRDLYMFLRGENPTLKDDTFRTEFLAEHARSAVVTAIQAFNLPLSLAAGGSKLKNLYLQGRSKRVERNLKRVLNLFMDVSDEERIALPLLHDAAKSQYSWTHNHDRQSFELIRHINLLRGIAVKAGGFEEKDADIVREIDALAIKYHHAIGAQFQGGYSLLSFVEMLEDRDVKSVLEKDGGINLSAASLLLDRILFLTIADVGGVSAGGFLSNLRIEYYFSIRDKIMGILKRNGGSYSGAIEEIRTVAAEENKRRLAAIVSPVDTKKDLRGREVEKMDELGEGALDIYFDTHVAPHLPKGLLENFHRIQLPVFDFFEFTKPRKGFDEKINPNLFAFLGLLSALAVRFGEQKGIEYVEMIVVDGKGEPIRHGFPLSKVIDEMIDAGTLAKGIEYRFKLETDPTDPHFRGNRVYLVIKNLDQREYLRKQK